MSYSTLKKKERQEIFTLFLYHDKLKFNEIEKKTKIRSNTLAYHIKEMQKDSILEKKGEYYFLTDTAEKLIPIFSNTASAPVATIVVIVMHHNKILMIKRNKRPYKDYWSLIGGKIHLDESIEESSLRIVKEKTGIDAEFISVNAMMQERIVEGSDVKHNFLIVCTQLKAKNNLAKEKDAGEPRFFTRGQIDKLQVLPTDHWLIKNRINKNIDMREMLVEKKEDEIIKFRIRKVRS